MTVSNGDILKVTTEWTLPSGTITQNIYHLRAQLAAPQADLTVVNAVETWIEDVYAELAAATRSTVVANLCSVDKVAWDGTKWEVTDNVGTFTPSFTPTAITDIIADQISPFIIYQTARPKTKGKKFHFGFTENDFNGSFYTTTLVNALVAAAAEVLAGILIGPLNDLVPGVPRSTVNIFYDFLAAVVTNVTGTQRRRRPGVGI